MNITISSDTCSIFTTNNPHYCVNAMNLLKTLNLELADHMIWKKELDIFVIIM